MRNEQRVSVVNGFQNVVKLGLIQNQEDKKNQSTIDKVAGLWFKERTHTSVINFQRVLYILKQYSPNRSREQLDMLKEYFDEHFEYMNKFKSKLDHQNCLDLFRDMQLEVFQPCRIVFNHGDSGRKMYFVLQGEVGVLIAKSIYADNQYDVNSTLSFEAVVKHQFADFMLVHLKKPGDVFGEIAIEQKVTRTATLITKSDTILATITFDLYQRILSTFQIQVTNQKLDFLSRIPLFKNWQRQHQLVLLNSLEILNLRSGQQIFGKGCCDQYIYLVISGEIELEKIESKQDSSNYEKKHIIRQLLHINSGQFFGEYEHLNNLAHRITSSKSMGQSQIYKIRYQQLMDFFKLFSSQKEFLDQMAQKQRIEQILRVKCDKFEQEDDVSGQVQEQKIDIESIRLEYFKKVQIEKQIKLMSKKIKCVKDGVTKATMQAEIDVLKESTKTLEIMHAQKFAYLVPYKNNPYLDEGKLIKSNAHQLKRNSIGQHTILNESTSKQKIPSQFSFMPQQKIRKSVVKSESSSRQLSRIISNRLVKLGFDPNSMQNQDLEAEQSKRVTNSLHSKTIHNTNLDQGWQPKSTHKRHNKTEYKFQLTKL